MQGQIHQDNVTDNALVYSPLSLAVFRLLLLPPVPQLTDEGRRQVTVFTYENNVSLSSQHVEYKLKNVLPSPLPAKEIRSPNEK